jgi:hypothetical protein
MHMVSVIQISEYGITLTELYRDMKDIDKSKPSLRKEVAKLSG